MSTTTLQKKPSPGAILIKFLQGKYDALRYLPKLANGYLRFDADGNLIADDADLELGTIYKAVDYTANPGERIAVDTTVATKTLTLPATPTAGQCVEIYDAAGTFGTNNLTVGRNSEKIDSAASNLTVSENNAHLQLIYINSTIGWKTFSFGVRTAAGNATIPGTLAVTGITTLSERLRVKTIATAVAATGAAGGVAGAAQLGNANIVRVSSDGATKGVKLPTGVAGDVVQILNTTATACNLFAASGGTINGGSTDAGCAIPASKGVVAICTAADTWTVFDRTANAGAAA